MDLIGLATEITVAVTNIDTGRKGFAIRGKEQEGRISYEEGIADASVVFREANDTADPFTIILADYTYVSQELQLCSETDKKALSSLTMAKQNFDDAFLALQVVENAAVYKEADKLFLHDKDYRVKGFPKDAFHLACKSHIARLTNTLKVYGVDPIEKSLIELRIINMKTAQKAYLEKQMKAMAE